MAAPNQVNNNNNGPVGGGARQTNNKTSSEATSSNNGSRQQWKASNGHANSNSSSGNANEGIPIPMTIRQKHPAARPRIQTRESSSSRRLTMMEDIPSKDATWGSIFTLTPRGENQQMPVPPPVIPAATNNNNNNTAAAAGIKGVASSSSSSLATLTSSTSNSNNAKGTITTTTTTTQSALQPLVVADPDLVDADEEVEYVSIHYPRLFFFNLLFMIPFVISLLLLFLQDVFTTFSRDYSTSSTGMDFKFGVFVWSYRIDDVDYKNGTLPYTTQWTTQTYGAFCASIPFETQFSSGSLIDRNFFCHEVYWTSVQYLSCAAVGCGLLFIMLLMDNIIVWNGYSWWFHPTRRSDTSVKRVRRFFKIGLMFSVLGHFLLQASALALIFYIQQGNLITFPTSLQPFIGWYGGVASVSLDLLFLAFFNYSDQLTFFHVSLEKEVVEAELLKRRNSLTGSIKPGTSSSV